MRSSRVRTRLTLLVVHVFVAVALWIALTASGCSASNAVSGDASVDSTSDQTTATCSGSQKSCGGSCVNTQSDPNNCGGCGVTCTHGLVCSSGSCAVGCATGQMLCGVGSCANTQTDFDNCGSCGNQCQPGQNCSMGKCSLYCGTGTTSCSGSCVNEQTDNSNCGGCNMPCGKGLVCSGGVCGVSCGLLSTCNTDAGAYCTNLQTDNANCGTCGNPCPSGEACSGGQCQLTCQMGLVNCNGTCVDPTSDPNFCGANGACGAGDSGSPGTVCSAGQACGGGVCAISCPPGQVACNGTCIDPKSNSTYCGASPGCGVSDAGTAGTTCPGGQICSAGTCQATCGTGLVLCNVAGTPTCVDPRTNGNFCGATSGCNADAGTGGAVCAAGTICAGGACSVSCLAGTIECPGVNGICVDPLSNPTFCGASGNCQGVNAGVTCAMGHVCSNGNCLVSCIPGQVDCQNQCIDPSTSNAYCGAINNCTIYATCQAGQVCADGGCVLSCQAGLINCKGTCINPNTNRSFCGADPTCTTYAVCNPGQVCTGAVAGTDAGSTCQVSCLGTEAECAGTCIDPMTDSLNCGATAGGMCSADAGVGTTDYAGVNCQTTLSGSTCSGGTCVCPSGFINCNNVCIDPKTNDSFCGASGSCTAGDGGSAGTACSTISGSSCSNSTCNCPSGQINCNGVCIDPTSNNTYCGATGNCTGTVADAGTGYAGQTCGPSTLTQCIKSSCVSTCTGGDSPCLTGPNAPYCADFNTSNSNCGGCGIPCGPLTTCEAPVFPSTMASCVSTCVTGQSQCSVDAGASGAYCAYTQTDNNNCGSCGNGCPYPLLCSSGTCGSNCGGGITLCNGPDAGVGDGGDGGDGGGGAYCADTTLDINNCGTCGNVCTSSPGSPPNCVDSVCCGPGSNNVCNGNCVNTNTDPTNCGTCNHKCPTTPNSAKYCWAGICQKCEDGDAATAECTSAGDPEGPSNTWVVCGAPTCASGTIWISSTATCTPSTGSQLAYHPQAICASLGYPTVTSWGPTLGDICGGTAPLADAGPVNSCSSPGSGAGNAPPFANSGAPSTDSTGLPALDCGNMWACSNP